MSLKSFFYDRLLLIGILVTAALILWWLTDDIIVALVCLFSLIIISFIARLYQPWNEEKVIEELNIQNQKKNQKNLFHRTDDASFSAYHKIFFVNYGFFFPSHKIPRSRD